MIAPDRLERVLQDGKGPQAQEVHLEQADLLHRAHVPLGGHVTFARAVQGDVLHQRCRADHHTGRVGRGVASEPLENLSRLDQVAHLRVLVVPGLQIGTFLERLLQRDVQGRGDHLRDPVDVAVGHSLDATHVAYDRARGHRSEGDDLRDVLRAVLLDHVADHLRAPAVGEIHVDIGHADPLGVQETLEDQVVANRVDIRDAEAIGGEAARRRSTPRSDRHSLGTGMGDEVLDDQEVTRIVHLPDHVEFVPESRDQIFARVAVASPQSRHAERLEISIEGGVLRRAGEVRQPQLAELERYVAHLRDLNGVVERIGDLAEEGLHLLRALQIHLRRLEPKPVHVGLDLARLDAEQRIVRRRVLPMQVVAVVGDDGRKVHLSSEIDQPADVAPLVLDSVILDLEVVGVENLTVEVGRIPGLLVSLLAQVDIDLAVQTPREADQALPVLPEQFLVDAGPVVESLEKGIAR